MRRYGEVEYDSDASSAGIARDSRARSVSVMPNVTPSPERPPARRPKPILTGGKKKAKPAATATATGGGGGVTFKSPTPNDKAPHEVVEISDDEVGRCRLTL